MLRGARILDPLTGLDLTGDVIVDSGRPGPPAPSLPQDLDAIEVDCRGRWLFPGLVDMHAHLRVPGGEQSETLETGLRAAIAGGVTRVGMMPNTSPSLDSPDRIVRLMEEADSLGLARGVPIPCVTEGRSGRKLADLRALHGAGACAFSDDGSPVWDSALLADALRQTARFGGVIIEHPENPGLSGGAVNLGRISSMLGVAGIPEEAETSDVERCLSILESVGGRLHLTHLSSPRSVRLAVAAAGRIRGISFDVTPHHLALDEDAVLEHGTLAKMNPPLRSPSSRIELIGELLSAKGVDWCIASDHAPHHASMKARPMEEAAFGITGLETLLPISLEVLHRGAGMDLLKLLGRLTLVPARILGIPEPSLRHDRPAEMVLFDPGLEYTPAEVGSFSKSSNTPFLNTKLSGRTQAVWMDGRLIYRDGAFIR
jgi:dihydroorotase